MLPRDRDRMVPSSFLEPCCCMPLTVAISLMPSVWPEMNKVILYFMLNHYRHKTKLGNAPDIFRRGLNLKLG
jgi:hypothetical protein